MRCAGKRDEYKGQRLGAAGNLRSSVPHTQEPKSLRASVPPRVFLIPHCAELIVTTNELVEWFNSVDATYRSDLRELNELNFARFDAKVEQRWAQLDAKLEQRLAQVDAKLAQADAKLEQRVAELRAEMREGFARVDQRFAEFETKLTKRLFAFWVTQAATTVGLVLGVVKLLR